MKTIVNVINMFRLVMGAYAIRRNNDLPFVNGGISASMKSGQPQKSYSHEAVYRFRLYNFYCLSGGVLKNLRKVFLRSAYAPITKQLEQDPI